MKRFAWRTAFRIALREWKSSALKFAFVAFGVAAGVGALTGVRGFSSTFLSMLLREARTLMAADVAVRVFAVPTPVQQQAMDEFVNKGALLTNITETFSMMSSAAADPVLVSIKAVDPSRYPFYGKLKLDPPARVADELTDRTLALSDDLLLRLNVKVGDTVRLGGQDFRIFAVVLAEPDRMTGSLNVGPRVLISRSGLERTGLIQLGSRASQRFLFKLPPAGVDVDGMCARLRQVFPEAQVVDFKQTHPAITRSLERATTFLSLVSLIALIVGALGVATAVRAHLEQRLDTIAIMKCLGARSSQIIRIFALQTAMLGLTGSLAGLALGAIVQKLFPFLVARYFQFQGTVPWNPSFAIQGIAVGMLVTMLFTLPPLLSIRSVRPALVFRREMANERLRWRERIVRSLPAFGAGAMILVGVGGIAGWLAESPKMGTTFVLGLVISLLVLAGVAWLLLRGLKGLVRTAGFRFPVAVRHGLANLYRPGNHAASVLVALGIGVMFMLTIYLVQKSLLVEVMNAAPPGMPNVFMINITDRERDGILDMVSSAPGLKRKPQMTPLVAARLVSIDDVPLDGNQLKGFARRFLQTRSVTWAAERPEDVVVRQGAWWKPGQPGALISVSEDAAEALKLKLGQILRWTASGREVATPIVAVHRNQAVGMGPSSEFIFAPEGLSGLPVQWFASARLAADRVSALQRAAYRKYPTVTVINAAEVLAIVQQVVDQVALVVRFISLFAILAGGIILASAVAGSRFRRIREVAILKTLGARRSVLVAIFSVEFLVLGIVAGLMGSVLGTLFSRLLLTRLLDAQFRLDVFPNLVSVLATAALAVATGWLASVRILGQKPLESLRDE
jgi:putative ABC transport system permease protein